MDHSAKMNNASDQKPIFTAADLLAYRWKSSRPPRVEPPEVVILCFQPSLMQHIRRRYALRRVRGFFGDLFLLKTTHNRIAISGNCGIGAPVAAIQMEELAAFGVRRFLSIGVAAGLQAGSRPGDWLVCTRALRDEGTSAHYLPPGRWVDAHIGLTETIHQTLALQGFPAACGSAWTTDAPYRELINEVDQHRADGISVVDMEMAALFAVGQALKLEAAGIAVIADQLTPEGWQPANDMCPVWQSLQQLLAALLHMFAQQVKTR